MKSRWKGDISPTACSRCISGARPNFVYPATHRVPGNCGFSDFFKSFMRSQFGRLIMVIIINILFRPTSGRRSLPLTSTALVVHCPSRFIAPDCCYFVPPSI